MSDTKVRPSDLMPAPSHIVGPTWQRKRDGSWHLPERTLGWVIINWLATFVRSPGGDDPEAPFIPTDEQARFLLWWYAVDEQGRFVYRSGVLRRMKGWGKDPLTAALALVELCGPSAFSHFHPVTGEPVGKRRTAAWIQLAAVTHEQTDNTFNLFPRMISPALKDKYELEVQKTIISIKGGLGKIQGVTSNPLAMEGKRPTFVILNETQWWMKNNQGHTMYKVVTGNVAKIATTRYLAICNAHIPGQESIGERMWENYRKVVAGRSVDTGLLYDALEAPADTPVSEIPSFEADPEGFELGVQQLREGLEICRGDSTWLPIDEIIAAILDENNEVTESRRMYLNQVNAAEDAWLARYEWETCRKNVKLESGDQITVGFDGSSTEDYTAVVVCRVPDGALFPIKIWNPKDYPDQEVPKDQVDATVRMLFESFDVVGMRADVKEFETYVADWTKDFRKRMKVKASPNNPIAFDMRGQTKRFALDCEAFHDAVLQGALCHNGSEALAIHILNAHKHPTTFDAVSIRKASKDSPRKIDAAVCAVLAFASRQDYLMTQKRTGRLVKLRD